MFQKIQDEVVNNYSQILRFLCNKDMRNFKFEELIKNCLARLLKNSFNTKKKVFLKRKKMLDKIKKPLLRILQII